MNSKLVFMILVALAALSAVAQSPAGSISGASDREVPAPKVEGRCGWKRYGKSNEITIYLDRCTVRDTGRHRLVWTLSDYALPLTYPNKGLYSSAKVRRVIDCSSERLAYVGLIGYREPMGAGQTVWTETVDEGRWAFVDAPPGSVDDWLIREVCK